MLFSSKIIVPKKHFHFSFGSHGSAQDHQMAKNAFEKFGPFHVYAGESNFSEKEYGSIVPMWNAAIIKMRQNPQLKLKSNLFLGGEFGGYKKAELDFIVSQPSLLYAPLDTYPAHLELLEEQDALKAGRMQGIPEQKLRELWSLHLMTEALERDVQTIQNMDNYWERIEPLARGFAPHILALEEVRVFVRFGGAHHMLAAVALEEYADRKDISVSFSSDDPADFDAFVCNVAVLTKTGRHSFEKMARAQHEGKEALEAELGWRFGQVVPSIYEDVRRFVTAD